MAEKYSNARQLVIEDILSRSQAEPGRPALADNVREISYGDLGRSIVSAAASLRRLGVEPGERVVIDGPNSARVVIAHLAIIALGAVAVPLGRVSSERLSFVAADCGASVLCTEDVAAKTALVGPGIRAVSLDDLAAAATPADLDGARADFCRSDLRPPGALASLMYTTGSTGQPKGVMITHGGLRSALSHIVEYVGFNADDREAIILPLSHSFGMGQLYCTLATGGFAWVNEGLRPLKAVFETFDQRRISAFSTTPSMLRLLLGIYRKPFLDSARYLKRMVVNSEPLPPEQAADVMQAFPDLDLVVYYGLTEASRSTFLRPRLEPVARHRSVGQAAPRVEIQIQGLDGAPAAPGTEGEVRIRGGHLAAGYWNRPDEQAGAFREGWLHTGDLGRLDEQGYLTVTGRLKDQINVGGVKISAAEVEKVIRAHPMVTDVAAIGLPDADGLRGEIVAVAVVAKEDIALPDLIAFCAGQLEAAVQPQKLIAVEAIPRAETGKVLKGELRRLFESKL